MTEQLGEYQPPVRWPVGLQGDVEDAVVAWLDKDDLANAEGSMFDAIIAALGLELIGWCDDPEWTDLSKTVGRLWHKSKPRLSAVPVYRLAAKSGSTRGAAHSGRSGGPDE